MLSLLLQVSHNEKLLATARESRGREVAGHRGQVARLQAENMDVLVQLNQSKRDLKVSVV